MAPQFISQRMSQQALLQPLNFAFPKRKSLLYNSIKNHLFKVYRVFFPHPGNEKGISN